MMNLVNGYVCANCTDVELAKRGVDPAHPQRGVQGSKGGAQDPKSAERVDAASDNDPDRDELGKNRPVDKGEVGTRLNLFA